MQDEHADEQGTCYIVKGRGLVVISSCGHTGIVNTVKTAMNVANVTRLHAVIGGFHLGMAPPEYIRHTVDAPYRAVRDSLPSRRTFFEHLRALIHYLPFDDWDYLMLFMIKRPNPDPPGTG